MTGAPGPVAAPATHTLDRATFLALAGGRGGAGAVALLRAGQLSKRRLLLSAVRRAAAERGMPSADRARLDGLLDGLEGVRRLSRPAWEGLLLQPYLDLWAANCLRALYGTDGGGTDGGADPTAPGAEAADPAGLAALLLPFLPDAPPSGRPHRLALDHAGQRLDLWIDDRGPYREVHGERLAGPLGAADLDAWRDRLSAAWELLVRRHPWHAEAVAAGLTTLVPLLPRPDGTAVSSAARRAFGAVALSLPGSPELLALALVHEFMHAQLGALMDLVALHGPDSGTRYHAPWRQDARPAGALLQGTYAHLGVADFWRTEAAASATGPAARAYAAQEYARWRPLALEAAETLLSCGELTDAGREFTAELARVLAVRQHAG